MNQEHVKWLKEGVEAWNRRREQEDFIPDLSDAYLFRYDLRGANLRHADLRSANLRHVNLSGANLRHADLRGAKLCDAALIGTHLNHAKLRDADLSDAELCDADLRGAKLINSNLIYAKLIDADLTYAKLKRADLREADLSGAKLNGADLCGADLSYSEPWKANLYNLSKNEVPDEEKKKIKSISCLLKKCRSLRNEHRDDDVEFFFRGERSSSWELRPSVMRPIKGNKSEEDLFSLCKSEGEMLLDLMSRQPEAFNGLTSAIDQWVLAQHHELKTRLLDITRNPLVALFNVCKRYDTQNGSDSEDGRLHVFAVPRDIVKPFNSDSISIIANFSKLRRSEQNLLLGKKMPDPLEPPDPKDEPPAGNYAEVMDRLYHFIRHEKPYFMKKIDPRDLFRVFVVEPQRSFERIRAQSGAFLISAFHERFEHKEINKILESNTGIPVYDHYTLTVSGESKECIMDELRLLNITHESLFPGLDEAAKAVIQRYST